MEIKAELLREHSRKQTDRIVHFIGNNPARFDLLMQAFFLGEYRVSQRAAWPMSICTKNHPALIRPYLRKLIKKMDEPGVHDALIRNTLRLLQFISIPKSLQGKLMDQCFLFVQSPQRPAAIKAFAITVLSNLAVAHPAILNELSLVLKTQWPNEGAAFRSRARKILKQPGI